MEISLTENDCTSLHSNFMLVIFAISASSEMGTPITQPAMPMKQATPTKSGRIS